MFTDTHCHIYNEYYDIDNILENAKEKGITKMINNGYDYKSNVEVLNTAKKYNNVYAAIGYHPENIGEFDDSSIKFIEDNIENVVAIGEIGLDYYNGIDDHDLQKKVFKKQIELAIKYDKPVIIHSREATKDTIDILKLYPSVRGSIHCFSGSLETAKIYIKMGFKLGFGGVLTFKNSKLYEVLEQIPLESVLLETDSPYLTPEPFRGKKNEPANVYYVAQKICDLRNISMEELSIITEKNVKSVFDI